eukprot:2587063-Rhodomonas_salina.1
MWKHLVRPPAACACAGASGVLSEACGGGRCCRAWQRRAARCPSSSRPPSASSPPTRQPSRHPCLPALEHPRLKLALAGRMHAFLRVPRGPADAGRWQGGAGVGH